MKNSELKLLLSAKLHNLLKRNKEKVINAQKVKVNSNGKDQYEEVDQDEDSKGEE